MPPMLADVLLIISCCNQLETLNNKQDGQYLNHFTDFRIISRVWFYHTLISSLTFGSSLDCGSIIDLSSFSSENWGKKIKNNLQQNEHVENFF